MSETAKERQRIEASGEAVVDPVSAAFAESLEAKIIELQSRQANYRAIEETWDVREVGRLLGFDNDTPIRESIAPAIAELLDERDDMIAALDERDTLVRLLCREVNRLEEVNRVNGA